MTRDLNRRDMLKSAGLAAAGLLASPLLQWAAAQESKPRKVLFFTRSQDFPHPVVTRPENNPEKLAFAEQFMVDFGKEHQFEVTPTKDGTIFTPEGLAPFDLIMFYTTGYLDRPGKEGKPMPRDGKQALLDAVAGGKGFLGLHCASDTFHSPRGGPVDPYIDMLGGEFVIHHAQQDAKLIAADHDFGSIKGLEDFTKHEEWYILKNFAPDLHVILIQDTQSMPGKEYRALKPYPETWARHHGKGRVFYSSMGHREDVWKSEQFQKVLLGGLQWAAGNVEADVTPNIDRVTPGVKNLERPAGAV